MRLNRWRLSQRNQAKRDREAAASASARANGETPPISTGHLPDPDRIKALVHDAYDRFKTIDDGAVANYIPALAAVPRDLFGLCVVGVNGAIHGMGDINYEFSIQSVSKPFVFALICQAIGEDVAQEKLGVNSTGLPFNSVIALERIDEGTNNPMVNAGAIATTSLAPGDTAEAKWQFIQAQLSRFAGRDLSLNQAVYESEAATNQRNTGIAKLLQAYDRIFFDPVEATDIYTKQCSLNVTARDLAVMAATLANGGVNPVTQDAIIDPIHCQHVLAVMVTAGLYENSGDWLYETGLPGKSGVSGGLVTVSPGKGGLATFAPPLDEAGNSVKGQLVTQFLSEQLGLNLFASRPNT
nr:glutaminase A [Nodosilinea nodulosa]